MFIGFSLYMYMNKWVLCAALIWNKHQIKYFTKCNPNGSDKNYNELQQAKTELTFWDLKLGSILHHTNTACQTVHQSTFMHQNVSSCVLNVFYLLTNAHLLLHTIFMRCIHTFFVLPHSGNLRLSTTPCWPRLVSTITVETTLSSAQPAANTTGCAHWQLSTLVSVCHLNLWCHSVLGFSSPRKDCSRELCSPYAYGVDHMQMHIICESSECSRLLLFSGWMRNNVILECGVCAPFSSRADG